MGFSRIAAPVALLATVASAAQYRWNLDNDWSTGTNWEGSGGVNDVKNFNLNVDCINNWGTGATVRVDEAMTVGTIDLPMNGEITFNGDMEVTFNPEAATGSKTWKCKTQDQLSSACPSNYLLADGTVPTTPPCLDDSIVINGDQANQILWAPGQFVASVEVESAADDVTYTNNLDFGNLWAEEMDTSFLGAAPALNTPLSELPFASAEQNEAMCINTCPSLDLSGEISGAERYTPAGVAELARLTALRDVTTQARAAATAAFDSDDMYNQLNILQAAYVEENNIDLSNLTMGAVTMPELVVGGATMGDWLESTGQFERPLVNMIKYGTTKKVTDRTMDFVESKTNDDVVDIWSPVIGVVKATASVEALDVQMQSRMTAGSDVCDGCNSPYVTELTAPLEGDTANYPTVQVKSCKTLLAYVAPQTEGSVTTPLNVPFKLIKPTGTTWGKAKGAPLNANADYDFAPGAVAFTGVQIQSKVYVKDGVLKSAVAPKVLEYLASSAVVQMALYSEEKALTEQVSRVASLTTTTTIAPAASSSEDDDSSGMMMIIIAGAAGLLLCLIIVVVVFRMGGSDDGEEKGSVGRGVVSFENPMYDDPSAGGAAPNEDGGLYDEPAFNADGKENPMYASNENTAAGGGYLDVEPDDGDDESDEDSEGDE
jgi:hypothetical protein